MNSKVRIEYKNNAFTISGEPTEAALKVFAEKLGKYTKLNTNYKVEPTPYAKALEQ